MDMDSWAEIPRLVLVEGVSKRSVCREFGIRWGALNKIPEHGEPRGHGSCTPRTQRKTGDHFATMDQMLRSVRYIRIEEVVIACC